MVLKALGTTVVQLVRTFAGAPPQQTQMRNVLIVKRDLSAEHYAFCEALARSNAAEVLVDRRREQRRGRAPHEGEERRRADRRDLPPAMWDTENFMLTRILATSDGPAPRRQRRD